MGSASGLRRPHDLQRQQRGAFRLGCKGQRALCGIQRALGVAGEDSHAPRRDPGGLTRFWSVQVFCQRLFDDARSFLFVGHPQECPGNRRKGCWAVLDRQGSELRPQQFANVTCLVEGDEDLQCDPAGGLGSGLGLAPGARSLQCGVTRASLQGNVHSALVKIGVVCFARGIKQLRKPRAGLAILNIEFAEQYLEKKRGIHG
jgi:hypothetical protein